MDLQWMIPHSAKKSIFPKGERLPAKSAIQCCLLSAGDRFLQGQKEVDTFIKSLKTDALRNQCLEKSRICAAILAKPSGWPMTA